MSSIYLECIQCGDTFELTDFERKRFAAKRFDYPRRCPDCRKHRAKADDNFHQYRHKKRDYRLKYDPE